MNVGRRGKVRMEPGHFGIILENTTLKVKLIQISLKRLETALTLTHVETFTIFLCLKPTWGGERAGLAGLKAAMPPGLGPAVLCPAALAW